MFYYVKNSIIQIHLVQKRVNLFYPFHVCTLGSFMHVSLLIMFPLWLCGSMFWLDKNLKDDIAIFSYCRLCRPGAELPIR